ncbi:hypothetical protein HDK64DRAFT_133623 [Phyllosticta capitalensis]
MTYPSSAATARLVFSLHRGLMPCTTSSSASLIVFFFFFPIFPCPGYERSSGARLSVVRTFLGGVTSRRRRWLASSPYRGVRPKVPFGSRLLLAPEWAAPPTSPPARAPLLSFWLPVVRRLSLVLLSLVDTGRTLPVFTRVSARSYPTYPAATSACARPADLLRRLMHTWTSASRQPCRVMKWLAHRHLALRACGRLAAHYYCTGHS